jgi:hypothetical protein
MKDDNYFMKQIEDLLRRVKILEVAFQVDVKQESESDSSSPVEMPSIEMNIDIHLAELQEILKKLGFSEKESIQRFDIAEILKSFLERRKTALDYRVKKHLDSLTDREKQILNSYFDMKLPFEKMIKIGAQNEKLFEI